MLYLSKLHKNKFLSRPIPSHSLPSKNLWYLGNINWKRGLPFFLGTLVRNCKKKKVRIVQSLLSFPLHSSFLWILRYFIYLCFDMTCILWVRWRKYVHNRIEVRFKSTYVATFLIMVIIVSKHMLKTNTYMMFWKLFWPTFPVFEFIKSC